MDDHVLLRRFVEERANEAFAALVERHVNLVYFAALRQTGGNTAMAEDVAQEVFSDLARKAASLVDRPVLAGWLYTSTRYAAANARRAAGRRRAREQEAYAMQEIMRDDSAATEWERTRPLIDEALHTLSATDREAVLLRFFQGRPFAEIGAALRLTEEAARKRVERAVDKLAAVLSRRGVTSTSAALGAVLVQQAAVAAPAGLAGTLAGSALVGMTTGTAAAGGAALGTTTAGFMASWKTLGVVSTLAVAAAGTAVYQTQRASGHAQAVREHVLAREQAEAGQAELKRRAEQAETRAKAAEQRAKAAEDDNAKLLAAIRKQSAVRTASTDALREAAKEPLTHDQVDARWRRAQELAKTGDPAEALRELLWCFDDGMPQVAGYAGVRTSFLLSVIAKLGEKYPAALEALRERRDAAQRRLLLSENDYDAVANFGSINRVLNEAESTLAVMDQFPPGDRRRRRLASSAIDELVKQRRYEHAMEARTFDQMVQFFMSLKSGASSAERKKSTVQYVAKYVEILAGAGQTEQAREFARQVLDFEGSQSTRELLAGHATRAGHPGLLDGTSGK